MNADANIVSSPVPDAGSNMANASPAPALSVVPPETPARRAGALNRRQLAVLSRGEVLGAQAEKADVQPKLRPFGIDAAFLAALRALIAVTRERATNAVVCTGGGRAATAMERARKRALLPTLRQIQAAAKQKHQFTAPAQLAGFLIGQRIDQSRAVLEQSSQTIISRARKEQTPGIDTTFLARAEAERAAYVQSSTPRTDERAQARTERTWRDQTVRRAAQQSKLIQFAADSAWPARVPENEGFRLRFLLPPRRALSR